MTEKWIGTLLEQSSMIFRAKKVEVKLDALHVIMKLLSICAIANPKFGAGALSPPPTLFPDHAPDNEVRKILLQI